jgi:tetratricopeptide (TPR) repeat protein
MRQNPDANRLLRILAVLPQGSKDLEEIAPDIPNVHKAATVLKQVGLAHVDGIGSLRVLAPVRTFIVNYYPPEPRSWKSVQKYFETLATMSSAIERGMEGKAIVERLSPQTSNMQAVFEHSLDIDGADFPTVIRAAIDLTDLFKYTGLGSLTTLIKSSKKAEAIGDKALLADCIRSQAEIHYSRSSRELATAGFEKALSLYREMDREHLSEEGRCTMMLGMVESQAGNYGEAIVHIERAIELHRRAKDVIGEADCLARLAQNAICQQKYSVAIPCVNAAVIIYQTHTHLRGQARCMWLLGVISQERRIDYIDASEKVADAALAYRFLGDVTGEANCLRILGRIALQTAKYGDAIRRLQTAMVLYRKVKRLYGEADCYQAQGEVYMGRRDETSAEVNFKKAKELYSEINHPGGKIFCTRALGDIAFRRRNYALAKLTYEQTLAMCRAQLDKCRAEFGIANVALAMNEDIRARELYDRVLPIFREHGHAVPDEAHTLKKLGDMAVKVGDDEQAKDLFEQALVKFRLTGIVPAQADCLVRLAEVAMRQSACQEAISRYEEAMGLYCEAEDEERRTLCSNALQELAEVVPRTSHQWVRLL